MQMQQSTTTINNNNNNNQQQQLTTERDPLGPIREPPIYRINAGSNMEFGTVN